MGKPKSLKKTNKTVLASNKKDIQKKSHAVPVTKINRNLIKKKDKKQLKHQKSLQGVLQTQKKFVEEKQRKKREKTVIVGDMKPLLDSLPSLDELVKIRDKSSRTGITSIDRKITRKPKNKKEKRKALIKSKTENNSKRIDHLQKVWKDPAFKNPRELIAEKIRQKNKNKSLLKELK